MSCRACNKAMTYVVSFLINNFNFISLNVHDINDVFCVYLLYIAIIKKPQKKEIRINKLDLH